MPFPVCEDVFFKEIYTQIYILLLFGVVFVEESEKILLPKYFIEGCGGDPPHPQNRHFCSQELALGQEASENKTKTSRGNEQGCVPPQLTTESEGAS